MTTLVERLRDAKEGGRELDAAIEEFRGCPNISCAGGLLPFISGSEIDQRLPHYTTSIDAALTLVPEGWELTLVEHRVMEEGVHFWAAKLLLRHEDRSVYGESPSAALALCIAAIQAREARHD